MKDYGKISVLMGIYNCADTLAQAIDSIISQTYENWELILCDDCSDDGTYELAKTYEKSYPGKIILLKNETNSRLAYTLNHCLEHATGKYIARMDGDDISVPDRFEKQLGFLEAHDGTVLVGTAMQRFSEKGLSSIDKAPLCPDRDTPYKSIPFNHATILCYKWVYDKLGGYTVLPRTVRGQDRDLWFRFLNEGYKGENMPDALYMVREDENAIRRRTVKDRWISYQTTVYGYKLLKYPKIRYVRAVLELSKCLVPIKAVMLYREWQKKRKVVITRKA